MNHKKMKTVKQGFGVSMSLCPWVPSQPRTLLEFDDMEWRARLRLLCPGTAQAALAQAPSSSE